MAQVSPAKVKVKGINQVALVVKDIQATVENYWNILGIGPWDIYSWEAPLVYDRKYHGKPTWARERLAMARVGAVELELCQPVEGDSIYRDFLVEHGEGLHHMNFLVGDVDETAEILAKEGFPSLQSARWGDSGVYNYIDIKPLRTIWEPDRESEHMNVVPTHYPDTAQTSPAKVKVKGINQVALVVKDIQATVENYWNILGSGPWTIYPWEAPLVYDRKYHGKPAWGREKIAAAQVGAVELELCQPVEGDSIYRDFLVEHGEGLHHMSFLVDDVDETAEILAKEGFPSLQGAHFGTSEDEGGFDYIYIEPLHTIWEPAHEGKYMNASHYPENST